MQQKEKTNATAILILAGLFFIFGFVTWLNGILIPFLKLACGLESDTQAFLVTFAFYMAYFVLALPASVILKKTGFKNGMILGLLIMAAGSLIFIPAANSRDFTLFLTGLFVQGAGLALLQTASNPYISIIGPIDSAAKRISIMGVCNKTAGMLSPLILGAFILTDAENISRQVNAGVTVAQQDLLLDSLAQKVIIPYLAIAIVLSLVAILIRLSSLPEIEMEEEAAETKTGKKSVLQFPHLLLGVLCLFLYTGVEVMAGDAIGIYGNEAGISLNTTKYFTSFTLLAMLLGYVIGIFTIPRYISQQKALAVSAVTGVFFTACIYLSEGYLAITFIALLGLSNALMWPAIFPLAISGLGRFTKTGSALLIMGIAGGALLPLLYTLLKDQKIFSSHLAFVICLLPCYLYIYYYAVKGYKAGRTEKSLRRSERNE